jgi:hypothetical protein
VHNFPGCYGQILLSLLGDECCEIVGEARFAKLRCKLLQLLHGGLPVDVGFQVERNVILFGQLLLVLAWKWALNRFLVSLSDRLDLRQVE